MDPRAARTRVSLQDALLQLARERPLDEISVSDVVARAGVNRSSFYTHYADKETLLADALERVIDDVSDQLLSRGAPVGMPAELHQYLQHIAANASLYRRVLGDHGSAVVVGRLRLRIERIVSDAVATAAATALDDLPVDVFAAGIAGSALGVLTAWVSRDPLPPVEVAAEWMWRVLTGAATLSAEAAVDAEAVRP